VNTIQIGYINHSLNVVYGKVVVSSEILTKHVNARVRTLLEFMVLKPGGT